MLINEQFLEGGKGIGGGWNRYQLEALGVTWPPTSGWKWGLVGTEIDDATARKFIALKDQSKSQRKKIAQLAARHKETNP